MSMTTIETKRMRSATGSWFGTAFACTMIAVALIGFLPSLLKPAGRRAPVSLLAGAHGVVFSAWLGIFLLQARLIAGRQIALHRRIGGAAAVVAAAMIPLGYLTSIAMVRRGFDLSGDLRVDHDPAYEVVFPLGDLFTFVVLLTAALSYRRHPDMHKRLMLFANIALMPAPLAHLIGHVRWLAALPGAIIVILFFCFCWPRSRESSP